MSVHKSLVNIDPEIEKYFGTAPEAQRVQFFVPQFRKCTDFSQPDAQKINAKIVLPTRVEFDNVGNLKYVHENVNVTASDDLFDGECAPNVHVKIIDKK